MPDDTHLLYLRILGAFYWVAAVLGLLFALLPLLMMLPMLGRSGHMGGMEGATIFFIVMPFWILFGLAAPVGAAVVGWSLPRHRNYVFCMVVAGLFCLFFPVGTVLGVATIVLLAQEPVRRLFGVLGPPPGGGDAGPAPD